ncbi:CAAX protease self-immunity [Longilinea arvoryzae]|uniref:CAAX protease self-immunity n=1 Tax=Longilinea arvoryzae TaxID=360412 RepID=A0A0S7BKK5_9CHLR|nr:CPBP family intramembrane glutamic endopeptidase [Longilinea arvoryzae]GAP15636.1 CAAX protease self-immunity [Longilinea arvoryzae]
MSRNDLILLIAETIGVIAVVMLLGLSPRVRAKREVKFIYPRREGLFALAGFAVILALAVIYYAKLSHTGLQDDLILAGLSALPFVAFLLVRRQPMRSAGWGRANLSLGLQFGLVLAILALFIYNRIGTILGGLSGAQIGSLLYWLAICLLEESIFRGYMQPRLSAWLGGLPGWILCAAMFAVWRLPLWLSAGGTFVSVLPNLGLALIQGLVLGYIQRKSGSVLAPALYRAVSTWASLLG